MIQLLSWKLIFEYRLGFLNIYIMVNKRDAKCKPLDDDIRKIENIFFGGRKLLYVTTMCEVQMLCCWILLHKNNEFLMYLVNSSEAKLITLWWLPLLTLLWTTQNYLWYYPLYCNACCTTTTIPWNQDLENKPEISPDPPLYTIKSDEKKLLFFCIPIYTYYIQISFYTIYLHR